MGCLEVIVICDKKDGRYEYVALFKANLRCLWNIEEERGMYIFKTSSQPNAKCQMPTQITTIYRCQESSFEPFYKTLSNAGINVCASQKLNTNFGPVINNFGVSPLKKEPNPSLRAIFPRILNPLSGFSKFRFCILVLITSNGALTSKLADAPAILATKFCSQLALL